MIELILFIILGVAAIMGALAVVLARNPVYSAMGLMLTLFSLAVFYVVHLAHFVAAVQVIVYAGAVMTLFLFVIMFIGVDRAEDLRERLPMQRRAAALFGIVVVGLAATLVLQDGWQWVTGQRSTDLANGTIEAIGTLLIADWLLPFEATSALLVVAAVGAIALAFYRPTRRDDAAHDESDVSA